LTARSFFTSPLGLWISALGATFLWGSAFPFIKISYDHLGIHSNEIGKQMLFAGYRFFLAGILLFVFFTLLKKNLKLRMTDTKELITIGFFQTFVQYVLFYIGLSMITGIQGSIIAGTTSFFQMVLAFFIFKEKLFSRRKIIGLSIGFLGVIFANLSKGAYVPNFGLGDVLLLSAMMCSAYGNILAKQGSNRMDVGYLTTYQMIFGSIGLLFIGLIKAGVQSIHFDGLTFLVLLYLSFLSATGFLLWNNVMKYNEVGKVSIFLFLVPVFGVFLSSIILNEKLQIFSFIGLGLVATGILLVNLKKKRSKIKTEIVQG
jgi:drug/metabolite transporter (DMT)-like permease